MSEATISHPDPQSWATNSATAAVSLATYVKTGTSSRFPRWKAEREVVVEHRLPVKELKFGQMKKGDEYRQEAKPERGEKWSIGPSQGGLATFWWHWGDLDGDLKENGFKNDGWFDG